jgi:hypothetical protein
MKVSCDGKGVKLGERRGDDGVDAWYFIYLVLGKSLGIIRFLKAAVNRMV